MKTPSPQMPKSESDVRWGVLSAVIAYTIWGFFPIYFKIMQAVPSLEILMHRIVWAVPFGALIILFRRQIREVLKALIKPKTVGLLALAAFVLSVNWGVYIWAVQNEHIFQASLGYYINPLIYVLVGVLFFGERLRKFQLAAVVLATLGVGVLTVYGGEFPAISLILAVSFTIYGVIRKQVVIGAMPGLFIETLCLFLPALIWLIWRDGQGGAAFSLSDPQTAWLLVFAGPLTVIPLLFFALAARRLNLSTIGFLQFIGPTLQFFLGLFYGEVLTPAHAVCFTLIWVAVVMFCLDALRNSRRARALKSSVEEPA